MANVTAIGFVEQGLVPDKVSRAGIRRLLKARLGELRPENCEYVARRAEDFVAMMDRSPVALLPEKANEQHYEIPAEFYRQVLGPRGKYSCAYWGEGVRHLAGAEQRALELTCEHANLYDGQDIRTPTLRPSLTRVRNASTSYRRQGNAALRT
jgi:cyclopropane-fatty-acyl-phospholipid synthase